MVYVYTEAPEADRMNRNWPRAPFRSRVSGYVDKQGREVIPPIFDSAQDFHEGLASVFLDGGEGVGHLDRQGNVVIRLDNNLKDHSKPRKIYGQDNFSEGLACIEISTAGETEYRCLTKAGEFLPRERFSRRFGPFHEGLAAFISGDKWGYTDRTEEIVCKPSYDLPGDFSEGLAPVRVGEHWGYIDRQMRFLIRPGESCSDGRGPLNDAEPFSGGLARVHIGGAFDGGFQSGNDWYFGAWYYMNKQGDLVRRIRHDDEPGPGCGMEYRRYDNAPKITEEMKRAWEKWQSDHQSAEVTPR